MRLAKIVGLTIAAAFWTTAAVADQGHGHAPPAHVTTHGAPRTTTTTSHGTPPAPTTQATPHHEATHHETDHETHHQMHPATTPRSPIATKIESHPRLASRVTAMLPPGMTMEQAARGFRNQGQFIAALQASQKRGIPFADLKAAMVRRHMSLGQAVHSLRPGTTTTTPTTTGGTTPSTTGATPTGTTSTNGTTHR
jgi:hypothetical protein